MGCCVKSIRTALCVLEKGRIPANVCMVDKRRESLVILISILNQFYHVCSWRKLSK